MAVQREYLSPNEIAELLGVSAFTIRRYIKLGELKAVKLLGGFRVHRDDLQHFLKAHEVNSTDQDISPEETTVVKSAPEPEKVKEAVSILERGSRGRAEPVRRVSTRTVPVSGSRQPGPGKKPRRAIK